jgi:signal transduction histidine kinase
MQSLWIRHFLGVRPVRTRQVGGVGTAEAALDRIFAPFVKTKHDWPGMGLSISQTIVTAQVAI